MSKFIPSNPTDQQNFLLKSKAILVINALHAFELYCTEFNLPGISTSAAVMPTPLADLKFNGDKLTFEDLSLEFLVREDLSNWATLFHWMQGVSFPDSFEQYRKRQIDVSESTLHIFTPQNTPIAQVKFHNLVPVRLGGIDFSTRTSDVETITASMDFTYDTYDISLSTNP